MAPAEMHCQDLGIRHTREIQTCVPREDVLKGTIAEADFAADLAKVIRGNASDDYQKPDRFFANTYPTQGLKNLLRNVLARLSGDQLSVDQIIPRSVMPELERDRQPRTAAHAPERRQER